MPEFFNQANKKPPFVTYLVVGKGGRKFIFFSFSLSFSLFFSLSFSLPFWLFVNASIKFTAFTRKDLFISQSLIADHSITLTL